MASDMMDLISSFTNGIITQPEHALLALGLALLCFAILINTATRKWSIHRASSFASCSKRGISELRVASPHIFPATPHAWGSLTQASSLSSSSHLVCYGCLEIIHSRSLVFPCSHCQIVVHRNCRTKVLHDCRPLAYPSDHPAHDWRPAGFLLPLQHTKEEEPGDDICLCCEQPTELNSMFSFEPIWVCSSCRGPAHMRCIVERNRAVFSSPTTRALDRHLAERGGIDESEDDEDPSGLFFAPFSTTSGSSPRHKATPHPFTSNKPCDVCSMGEGRRVILPPNLLRSQGLKDERGELASSPSLSSTPSFSRRSILEALPSKLMKHSNPQDRWSLFSLDPNISHPITPLVVFINSKSGPQAGQMLKMQCLQLLSPLQVVELPKEKPEPALRFFSSIPGARILVIGGDGTVSWILSCLDALQKEREDLSHGSAFSSPWRSIPVAVFPLGTGNDLARCLGWGGGMRGFMREPLPSLLNAVLEAAPVPLDRWDVCIRQEETSKGSKGKSIAQLVSSSLTGAKRGKNSSSGSSSITSPAAALKTEPSRVMNNYLGIGIDAQVAVEFHRLRENFPSLFIDQLGNKALYTGVGSIDLLRQSCAGLGSKLTLTCDGFEIPLPSDAHGLIILSIGCHMGGVKLWDDGLPVPNELKSSTMAQVKSSFSDGVLEVVAIGGVIHMGRLAVGLASAQRLCQCRSLSLTTKEKIPMQVDGEPWVQPPGTIEVNLRGGRGGVVLKRVESGLLQISQAIQAALEKSTRAGVINDQQRHKLTAEIMRGLEGWNSSLGV